MCLSHTKVNQPRFLLPRAPSLGCGQGPPPPIHNALFTWVCSTASELGLWLPAAGVCGKPEYESAQPSLAQDEEPDRQRDRGTQSHSSACSGDSEPWREGRFFLKSSHENLLAKRNTCGGSSTNFPCNLRRLPSKWPAVGLLVHERGIEAVGWPFSSGSP